MIKEIRFCLNADEASSLPGAYAMAIELTDKAAVSTRGRCRRNCLVPCIRADCTCSGVSTKLCVIIHNFAHQLLNQLLADRTVLAASQFPLHRYRSSLARRL
jgi:hypothetical protein